MRIPSSVVRSGVRYDSEPYNPTKGRSSDKMAKARTRVALRLAFTKDSPACIGISVFVPLEQFHDSSHVQLTQTLADGFAKDISDRSDGGRVLLPSRGMNRIAEILFDKFDWKLRSERPAQHRGSDTSGNHTPDRSGRNRIKDLFGIDPLPLKHPDQLGDRVDLDPKQCVRRELCKRAGPDRPDMQDAGTENLQQRLGRRQRLGVAPNEVNQLCGLRLRRAAGHRRIEQ